MNTISADNPMRLSGDETVIAHSALPVKVCDMRGCSRDSLIVTADTSADEFAAWYGADDDATRDMCDRMHDALLDDGPRGDLDEDLGLDVIHLI